MPRRVELPVLLAIVAVLLLVAAVLGRRSAPTERRDPRPSTFLKGRDGASGLAEAVRGLGIPVRQFRARPDGLVNPDSGQRLAMVILNPSTPLSPIDIETLSWHFQVAPALGDLVLAGPAASPLMRCFGYMVRPLASGPDPVLLPPVASGDSVVDSRFRLVLAQPGAQVDSTRTEDLGIRSCTPPGASAIDTLLRTAKGSLVALRLHYADTGGEVVLVAEPDLFRNLALRRTPAGEWVLGLFAGRYDQVVIDEYHHGFTAGGSLLGALLAWSRRSPLGWAGWQMALVGVLALLFGAVRFGPVWIPAARRRRSALEHVRALATALAAARGHDVAIGTMIRGLRRRLTPAGSTSRGHETEWLRTDLAPHLRTERAREAVDTLRSLTRPGQPATAVLKAANAVEDLWKELQR